MKSTIEEVEHVDVKSRKFAVNLKLENRMQKYTRTECFITLKDHKDNFIGRPQCRLINTAKTDLGRVAKTKVERINHQIRFITGVNQWQSTKNALDWFKKIEDPNTEYQAWWVKNVCTLEVDKFLIYFPHVMLSMALALMLIEQVFDKVFKSGLELQSFYDYLVTRGILGGENIQDTEEKNDPYLKRIDLGGQIHIR